MALKWADLSAEPGILAALDHAGDRPESGDQDANRAWSERFADGCAVAMARRLAASGLPGKTVRPASLAGGTEPITPLGAGTKKRIDVTLTDPMLGLEIGISLKGLNFRDRQSANFDKNLTGRLYELGDEVRLVHEHLPHACMAGVFFLPLAATVDKTDRANSSFANTVMKLRERTGRLDAALAGHAARCDMAFVALYADDADGPISRGVCRFFPVGDAPPRRGRPLVAHTLDVAGAVGAIVAAATFAARQVWGVAEED